LTPDEYLKRSLVSSPNLDRTFSGYPPGSVGESRVMRDFQPSFSQNALPYNIIRTDPCNDYFYHLDTCKKCQHKLKKRVLRYLRALQRQNTHPLLPGASGYSNQHPEKELFTDHDNDLDEMFRLRHSDSDREKKAKNSDREPTNESFSNFQFRGRGGEENRYLPAFILLAFGILTIYALENSKKIIGDGIKIVRG
jgi:hypothetical protein